MKTDKKEEKKERIMRQEIELYYGFIAPLTETRMNSLNEKLEKTYDEKAREEIKKEITDRREYLEFISRFRDILINIVGTSDILKDKTLTGEEKKYYFQKREDFRRELKEEMDNEFFRRLEKVKERVDLKTEHRRVRVRKDYPGGRLGDPTFIKGIGNCLIIILIIIIIILFFILPY